MTVRRILTINSGSSSLKVAVFEIDGEQKQILSGEVERIGGRDGHLHIKDFSKVTLIDARGEFADHGAALDSVLSWFHDHRPELIFDAVGHRVVHGGAQFREPTRVTPELIEALLKLVPIAPDHLPQAILAIQTAIQVFPGIPQIVCFDTAFHQHMPRVAQIYPLPRHFQDEGIIRFGFHGLSYEFIVQKLRSVAPDAIRGRVVIAHLGNGASLAAIRDGISVDTTMGFTPDGGLMMGTRSGDLDPGVLLYLLQERETTPAALNDLVNKQSGLLGISGSSADVRDLLEHESTDSSASEAIALFCYQAKKYLGAMAAALGGLETLVFTGGIGEHAAQVRWRICDGLEFLGIRLDQSVNETHASVISHHESRVVVRVMKTDEEFIIAQTTNRLISPT